MQNHTPPDSNDPINLVNSNTYNGEEQFRGLFDTMAQGVIYYDANGIITLANTSAQRILGLSLDQMLGKTTISPQWKIIQEDGTDFPNDLYPTTVALRTGQPVNGVVMGIISPVDGKCHWITVDAIPEFHRDSATPHQVYAIFRLAPFSIAISLASNAKYVQVNDAFLSLTGYTHEEVVGRDSLELGIWNDLSLRAQLKQSLEEVGEVHNIPVILHRKNGETIDCLYSATNIMLDGAPHIIAQALDITERNQIEEHLELLFNTLDVASDSVYWMDTEGRFCYANAAGCKALGYSKEELLSKRLFDVNPGVTPQKWDEVWHTIKEKGNYTSESVHRRKDGSEFPVEIASTYARFGDKEYINGFARDITERKKAEEALLESEMRLRDIIFSMADWVWEVDETGVYTYCSQKSVDILGYSPEEVIGKMPFDFMPADERERVAPVFSELATNKAPIRDLENWNIAKNGKRVCLLTNALPLLDEEGHLKGYRGVDKDITRSKLVQQALQESEEKFAKVFRDAPVLIAITDMVDATYLDVNEYALKVSGYMREEVIGHTAVQLGWISADGRALIIKELHDQGRITSLEMDFHANDGRVLHGLFNGEQIVVGGRPCLLTVTVDITERKLMEKALRESEEQYRQLFDHMLSGLMVCEVICDESGKPYDHRFVHGNPAFERLTGLSARDRIGKMSNDFLSGWPPELLQRFYKVAMTGEPFEYERYNEMLGRFYESRVFAPRYGQFAHVFTDITERKRTEEEKRRFYRDTIKSVTQGKLDIVQYDEVKDYLDPRFLIAIVKSYEDTIAARHKIVDFCKANGFNSVDASQNAYIDRTALFESGVGEALTNAVKHANGCKIYAGVNDKSIWVAVSDTGQGISTMLLPGATLRRGFSSKISMGMGYTIMMEETDNIMLSTDSSGTTVVLSVNTIKSKSSPCLNDFQYTWDDDFSAD